VLLLVQGFVFLWMTGRMTDLFPNRSPAQFAANLAADVSAALTERADADIDAYANTRYSSVRGFVIVLRDGRTVVSRRVPPPPMLVRMARGRLFDNRDGDGPQDRRGRFRQESSSGFDRGWGGRQFGFGPLQVEYAPVVVNGAPVGMVAVSRDPPPLSMALRALGPTLATVALVLLLAGTAISALVIFRPARRRLHTLQAAARAIGDGQSGVRAPESGGDEVTLLARAFNDMAARLEQRTEALENADRTRRHLLADVSHELTTPLAAIRGYVETLQMPNLALDQSTRARYLSIVNEETERLEHIVGDLLELARLEGGGGALRSETVPIASLLERVRHRHEPSVAGTGITLVTRQDPAVDRVTGDPNRLEQALQNLVANAVRHTPAGGRVTVSASALPGAVKLTVEDTGSGIPPEHLPHIFDRFYKADESRTGTAIPSGSGLGLSIVQAIVARHGGSVSASNVESGGARFEIVLPAADTAPTLGGEA
jgi:signal transduction histidine kinase